MRSGSQTSSISSAFLRAHARAKAAAAVKKAEMQKKRSILEAQSAMVIQKEQARIEQLCFEEEAAIAIAKANAIDNELGFKSDAKDMVKELMNEKDQLASLPIQTLPNGRFPCRFEGCNKSFKYVILNHCVI